MALRTRSWVMWVLAPLVIIVVAVIILAWHPVPPRKTFGDELLVNGLRIALPLVRCGFDTFLDGGSRGMECEDRNGEIHFFLCLAPDFRQITHQHLGKLRFTGSLDHFGTVVTDDADVRNLLYWTLDDQARKAGISFLDIKDLYPSLYQQWFAGRF